MHNINFLIKRVLRKLEVSHGKTLGLGTFFNSHSIFSEGSPGKTSKITFDCIFAKPVLSALQRCIISIFLKKEISRKLEMTQVKKLRLGTFFFKFNFLGKKPW